MCMVARIALVRFLDVYGDLYMHFSFDWMSLIYAVATAILGWLAGSVVPPPRTQRKVKKV